MPARSPRIAVYLPTATYNAVKRLGAMRGVGMSAVVRDFLVETTPVLERISNLLDLAARADRTALKTWAADLQAAQDAIEVSALDAMAQLDSMQQTLELQKPGRPPAGSTRPRKRGAVSRTVSRRGKRHD